MDRIPIECVYIIACNMPVSSVYMMARVSKHVYSGAKVRLEELYKRLHYTNPIHNKRAIFKFIQALAEQQQLIYKYNHVLDELIKYKHKIEWGAPKLSYGMEETPVVEAKPSDRDFKDIPCTIEYIVFKPYDGNLLSKKSSLLIRIVQEGVEPIGITEPHKVTFQLAVPLAVTPSKRTIKGYILQKLANLQIGNKYKKTGYAKSKANGDSIRIDKLHLTTDTHEYLAHIIEVECAYVVMVVEDYLNAESRIVNPDLYSSESKTDMRQYRNVNGALYGPIANARPLAKFVLVNERKYYPFPSLNMAKLPPNKSRSNDCSPRSPRSPTQARSQRQKNAPRTLVKSFSHDGGMVAKKNYS